MEENYPSARLANATRLLMLALILVSGSLFAQLPSCDPQVPYYSVDLTGQPAGIWISPPHSRSGHCCGVTGSDNCTSFEVTLDSLSIAVQFDFVSGAVPTGALFYQINCGPPVPVGQPICISGVGPHRITFCKPGNNQNTYSITAISRPSAPPNDTIRKGCNMNISAMGLVAGTITWNSISPGTPGQYNSYLSCTSGCASPNFNPSDSAPEYIQYVVCGSPIADNCGYAINYCDTVTIRTLDRLVGSANPNPATICSTSPGILLTGSAIGGDGNYVFTWKDNNGIVLGSSTTYLATAAGNYTLEVEDGLVGPTCPSSFVNIPVTIGQYPVADAGTDQTLCASTTQVNLNGSVTNASGGIWSGGAGTFSPSDTNLVVAYSPTPSEIASGSITLTLTTMNASSGCTDTSDQVTITFPQLLSVNISNESISCYGDMVTLSATVTGGTQPYSYSWSTGSDSSSISAGAGNYCITVSDSLGCISNDCHLLVNPPMVGVTTTGVDVTTVGGSDGSITAYPSGGTPSYSFLWSDGQTTQTAINLSAGTYSVTVTDSNGCDATSGSVVVSDPTCVGFVASIIKNDVTCFGLTNGSATVSTTGGVGPFTYSWNDTANQTDSVAVNLSAGNYSVSITDSRGCITAGNVTIFQPSILGATTTVTNVTVVDHNNGTATVFPSGGTSPYIFSWSNGDTTSTATGLLAGSYTYLVTDSNNCQVSGSVNVSQPSCSSFVANINATNVSCFNGSNGTATVTPSFGVAPYTYSWSNGQTTATATGLSQGSYSVTITDSVKCSIIKNVNITHPPALVLSTQETNVTCYSLYNGQVNATISGGTSPYSYIWSNGVTVEDLEDVFAGTYILTVTDNKGCMISDTALITQPDVLELSYVKTDATCNNAGDGSIDLTISGGTTPYNFSWSNNETTEDINNIGSGAYTISITDSNGCQLVSSPAILIDQPETIAIASVSIDCPAPGTSSTFATFNITGGTGGPYQVSLDNGNSYNPYGEYTLSVSVDTFYQVLVKDSVNCMSPIAFNLNINPIVNIDTVNFSKCSDGTNTTLVTVIPSGGDGGQYQVSFDNGSSFGSAGAYSQTLTMGNSYTIIVKDSTGCLSVPYTIFIPDTISITLNSNEFAGGYNINCKGTATGNIISSISGGTQPYTYQWSGPNGFQSDSASLNNLSAGTYELIIEDSNGCQLTSGILLKEPDTLNITLNSVAVAGGYNIGCNSANTGIISSEVSGGVSSYSYSWNGPDGFISTEANIDSLVAGIYNVILTDTNGCVASASITLSEPEPVIASLSSPSVNGYNITCTGLTNASISSTITGGTLPYAYNWSGPNGFSSGLPNISGLGVGEYILTVTDTNGCTDTASIILTAPEVLNADLSSPTVTGGYNITCKGSNTGSINLLVTDGTMPYTYSWSGPASFNSSNQNISNLVAGSYTVLVTDANGCTTSNSITLTEPDSIAISLTLVQGVLCNNGSDASIDAEISGGVAPYSYDWSSLNGFVGNTEDVNSLNAGTYSLVIIDANNCTETAGITISEPAALTLSTLSDTVFGGYNITCHGSATGEIDAIANGGTNPYNFTWTGPSSFTSTSASINNLEAGVYNVTVTDSNGCFTSSIVTLTQPDSISGTLSSSTVIGGYNIACYGGATGVISSAITGGVNPLSYSWIGPDGFTSSNQNLNALKAGTYTLTVTDANGCMFTDSIELTQPEMLTYILDINSGTCGGANGSIDLTVSGGTPGYSYYWSNGTTNQDLNDVPEGNYAVLVTDSNMCTVSAYAMVNRSSFLVISGTVTDAKCFNDPSGSIDLNVYNGTEPFTYNWSNGEVTEDIDSLHAGDYIITVVDDKGCFATDTFTINQPDELVVTLTTSMYQNEANISTYEGSDGYIESSVTGGQAPYSYIWSNGAISEHISNLPAGEYSVIVNDGQCIDSASATLTGPLDLAMPTGFSPNGNGANDQFVVKGIESYPVNDIKIFNRWGNIVYEKTSYNNEWDGSNKSNEPLPEGTYFVVLTINSGEKVLTGYVDLRR